jgi:hypothetical protein
MEEVRSRGVDDEVDVQVEPGHLNAAEQVKVVEQAGFDVHALGGANPIVLDRFIITLSEMTLLMSLGTLLFDPLYI